MEIVDNFLPQDEFETIEKVVMDYNFPWCYQDEIAYGGENKDNKTFYNTHLIYRDDKPLYPTSLELIYPILRKLGNWNKNYLLRTLVRVKINSYPNQNKFIEHSMHQDFPPSKLPYKTCLFCLNTCDGYTKLEDGTKIDSIANRAIFFDPTFEHCSTNTTDQPRRVNINFNYF